MDITDNRSITKETGKNFFKHKVLLALILGVIHPVYSSAAGDNAGDISTTDPEIARIIQASTRKAPVDDTKCAIGFRSCSRAKM
ncbi:MAG: hypothetical protein GY702_16720 [Desulfobulbaceae bacterium]|nr:hypothetical protein [Desulfobulbaceae bacterium]